MKKALAGLLILLGLVSCTGDSNRLTTGEVVFESKDKKVKGSGTITNPYKLSEKGDVVFASATLNGTSISFPKESDPYIPKTVTCTNGSVGEWNTEKQKIIKAKPQWLWP